MSGHDPLFESMLFNYETTNRTDFRHGAIEDLIFTKYKAKPARERERMRPVKDIQTMTDWKNPCVPMDLMVKPKDVVRTNPHHIQKKYVAPEDVDKERVRATRPRLVMTPAVSMDDIDDDNKRKILVKEMYASSTKLALEEAISLQRNQPVNVKAPLLEKLTPSNSVSLSKLQFPYVSPEWRMECVAWDSRQLRAHCDPCREFYIARPLRCIFCEQTAAVHRHRKMLNNVKRTSGVA